MNISIAIIKIDSISNIGSMNIGKTILCKNEASAKYYSDSGAKKAAGEEITAHPLPILPVLPAYISPVLPSV